MTRVNLLETLKVETELATQDLFLPVAKQREDPLEPEPRTPEVFLMRLPDSQSAKKKAPYVLHQFITGKDSQPAKTITNAEATVRTIFCVYHQDEQQGGLALLGLMERLRIHLLKKRVIGKQFQLDMEAGLESLVYPDDTAPYFAGEMISTWKLPAVEREVREWL